MDNIQKLEAVLIEGGFEEVQVTIETDTEGYVLLTVWPHQHLFQFQPPKRKGPYLVSKLVQRRTSTMVCVLDHGGWFKRKGIHPDLRTLLRDEMRLPFIEHVPILR